MISRDMKHYKVFEYGDKDAYGQRKLADEPTGEVAMAIYISSQAIQENINYKNASYVGFTHSLLESKNAIQYGDTFLKVLYVNPQGRINQVFMSEI